MSRVLEDCDVPGGAGGDELAQFIENGGTGRLFVEEVGHGKSEVLQDAPPGSGVGDAAAQGHCRVAVDTDAQGALFPPAKDRRRDRRRMGIGNGRRDRNRRPRGRSLEEEVMVLRGEYHRPIPDVDEGAFNRLFREIDDAVPVEDAPGDAVHRRPVVVEPAVAGRGAGAAAGGRLRHRPDDLGPRRRFSFETEEVRRPGVAPDGDLQTEDRILPLGLQGVVDEVQE